MEIHDGEIVDFTMKVIRSHRTPLTRQIHESVEIENSSANILMNSKGEYNGSKIPRIVIEVGDKLENEEWPGQEKKIVRSSRLEGTWRINNDKKRKRDLSVERNENSCRKKTKTETECGQAQLETEPSVECVSNAEVLCRRERRTKTGLSVATNIIPECSQAQSEDEMLCQALDRVELCHSIVMMVVEKASTRKLPSPTESSSLTESESAKTGVQLCSDLIQQIIGEVASRMENDCHTQARTEAGLCHTQVKIDKYLIRLESEPLNSRKRKLCENSELQPSTQPRRRRRKVENKNKVTNQEAENPANTSIKIEIENTTENESKQTPNFLSKQSTTNFKGDKGKSRNSKQKIQKTKITRFFTVKQAEETELMDWAGGTQRREHFLAESSCGGENNTSGGKGIRGGKLKSGVNEGVGARINHFQIRNKYNSSTVVGLKKQNSLAVSFNVYTDEDLIKD